ncbi:hypothetical protein KP509_37G045200 [Ceratopteris richardii]|uniref:Uncharacterized protein n=1 Tax=Ceratopteris richardii TaxID=49495 RepID=A0A8T2Q880_CERRI|nr:hypothetical protein KP509_37G045200 [Ceratopteris richardii]KAH7279965.1 hypothetical protein KP509_37G045200 [Ceratopteris richardii]
MAGKGPKQDFKDGHHLRENFHSKDSAHPGPPSGSGPAHPLETDVPRSMVSGPPLGVQPPPVLLEQKVASHQAEIQRLARDNQVLSLTYVTLRQEFAAAQQEILRLHQNRPISDAEKEQRFTVTQVALRQELADAKQEVGRLQEAMAAMQAEKEHNRLNTERVAQMEAELKNMEALRADFEKLRFERNDLVARLEHMSIELKKLAIKDQEIASLKSEVDEYRQRHQQARMDFELQKKLNLERLEQTQVMEKNIFTLTREVERLRTELVMMERRLHGNYPASNGPPIHSSAPPAAAYENNYSSQEEAAKAGQQNAEASKIKEAGAQGPPTHAADAESGWVTHTASNGKLFYYNTITGATQWNKPSSGAERQVAMNPGMDPASVPGPQQQAQPVMQQPPLLPPPIPPSMQQSAQLQGQQANYGVNLLVLGLSEGITDRDLASIFHPYGTVLYAKVMMDNKNGLVEFYGIVNMESPQAADAAAAAVNGMFILGRHIKVEVQGKGQWPSQSQQQGYHQPPMQPNMMQAAARWPHQAAPAPGPAGRWPY